MRIRHLLLLLCAAFLFLLTGCEAGKAPAAPTAAPTAAALPDSIMPVAAAPIGDAGLNHSATAVLYLPSSDGQQLLTTHETLTFTGSQHPAETVLRALFAHSSQLSAGVTLSLTGADPAAVSGGVCTVNLSASALQLSLQDFHSACLSITATLCALEDIHSVNILVAGRSVALDAAGYLPLGTLTSPAGQELPALWEQLTSRRTPIGESPASIPLASAVTLYFPLADASGVVPEVRRISFPGQHPQQLILALLEALSAGPQDLRDTADLPSLSALLAEAPEVTDLDSGGHRVTLRFAPDLASWLTASGADPACSYAAIVTTLTTFVPGLEQVRLYTGDRALTLVHSSGHGAQLFSGGVHRREDYSAYLTARATLYHHEEGRLTPHSSSLPYRSARSPRALLLALAAAPAECAVLPPTLTDADVLGVSIDGDVLRINLSDRYAGVIRESGMDQRLMAYAVVNTICEGLGVRRVEFFFNSVQQETLGATLIWSGEFMYNPGLIRR